MYYLFINECQIEPYNGEILKRFVGNKMVKAISNPTDENLKEFGYMELVSDIEPEFDPDTQYIERSYYVKDEKIYEKYEIGSIDELMETEVSDE